MTSSCKQRRLLLGWGLAASLCWAPAPGLTQGAAGYPARTVRIILPVPAGGASDTSARQLAQALSTTWGQQVIIENRPGASGSIAAQAAMAAAPDGHTLLWGLSSMAGTPLLQKSPPYKSLSEFAPISTTVQFAYALFVHPDTPAKTFVELQSYARSHAGQLNYGTGTLGEYMAAVEVFKSAGLQVTRIPYKGGSQLMTDLIGGQVQLNVGPIVGGAPHVRSGKLRALAVLTPQRSALFPELPTLAELGLPSITSPTWNALFAPPGTPRDITDKISAAVGQALQNASLRDTLAQQGVVPTASSPQQLAQTVESATQIWARFVREYDIPQE